jgi:hypothetical protein
VVPPPFPLKSKQQPSHSLEFSCTVVSIRRENIIINGRSVTVGIVRFVFGAELRISILADGKLLCEFPVTIQFDDEVVLCLPEPLDESNIVCRIIAIECTPNAHVLLGGMVELEIVICKDIQVEAEIKLEVLGKFCSPRPANIPVPTTTPSFRCPPFVFPPQCPAIFPIPNCDCQATVNTLLSGVTVAIGTVPLPETGTIQMIADICPSCNPGESTFTFNFFDMFGPTVGPGIEPVPGDQSFSFVPTTISSPTCITAIPGISGIFLGLVVTGTGIRTFTTTGTQEKLAYSLTLAETTGAAPDVLIFTLSDTIGATIFTASITTVPDTQLLVQDCVTFPDVFGTPSVP